MASEITLDGLHPPTPLSDDQPKDQYLIDDEVYPKRMEFPCVSLATLKKEGNIKRRGGEKTTQNSV